MNSLLNSFTSMILPAILQSVSPILVAQAGPLLEQLEETADSTPNPWDNILVFFLKGAVADMAEKMDRQGGG